MLDVGFPVIVEQVGRFAGGDFRGHGLSGGVGGADGPNDFLDHFFHVVGAAYLLLSH